MDVKKIIYLCFVSICLLTLGYDFSASQLYVHLHMHIFTKSKYSTFSCNGYQRHVV